MTRRRRVAVLFGGRSAEHEISCISARSVMDALDPERTEVIPIGITREGHPDHAKSLGAIQHRHPQIRWRRADSVDGHDLGSLECSSGRGGVDEQRRTRLSLNGM